MNTVYAIAIAFTSWDDCWNHYHAHKEALEAADHTFVMCSKLEIPAPSAAPETSLRPRMRPEGLADE